MIKRNRNFFTGLEDDDCMIDQTDNVDTNLDEDGEIDPVVTETDVPEDGKSPEADVVSVEDFNRFFNMGFEDDEEVVEEAADETESDDTEVSDDPIDEAATSCDEAPKVNVSVDIQTGDDEEAAGEEGFFFGFEDENDPIDEAAETSDAEANAETEETTDESSEEPEDNDVGVDVNINVNVDDGTSGDDGESEPANEEISQEDFDFGIYGLEDDEPEVTVDVTVDGEEQTTTTAEDDDTVDGDDPDADEGEVDPIDEAAASSDETPNEDEVGEEDDEEGDDEGAESFYADLF